MRGSPGKTIRRNAAQVSVNLFLAGQACRRNARASLPREYGMTRRLAQPKENQMPKMAIWDRYSAANGLDGLEIYDWRAEAVRFELTEGFPFAGFQDQCLKPLGHASKTSIL